MLDLIASRPSPRSRRRPAGARRARPRASRAPPLTSSWSASRARMALCGAYPSWWPCAGVARPRAVNQTKATEMTGGAAGRGLPLRFDQDAPAARRISITIEAHRSLAARSPVRLLSANLDRSSYAGSFFFFWFEMRGEQEACDDVSQRVRRTRTRARGIRGIRHGRCRQAAPIFSLVGRAHGLRQQPSLAPGPKLLSPFVPVGTPAPEYVEEVVPGLPPAAWTSDLTVAAVPSATLK